MTWKFRKKTKILPGFYLNFSNNGLSTTIGPKGFNVNIGKNGTYLNQSIQGTGISNRIKIDSHNIPDDSNYESKHIIHTNLEGEIKSASNEIITSESLVELKQSILDAHQERIDLKKLIIYTANEIEETESKLKKQSFFLWAWAQKKKIKETEEELNELSEKQKELKEQLSQAYIEVNNNFEGIIKTKFEDLQIAYLNLLNTKVIWDVTSDVLNKEYKSSASSNITRTKVTFKESQLDIIKSNQNAFMLQNANGGDIYIYPSFLILSIGATDFAVIDFKDLLVGFKSQSFLETSSIPDDTIQISTTWTKVNKDGSPDKRFVGNREIPVVEYGHLLLKTESGFNEEYHFSNFNLSKIFGYALYFYVEEFKKVTGVPADTNNDMPTSA